MPTTNVTKAYFISTLRDLLAHQLDIQVTLVQKADLTNHPENIGHSWQSIHFAVNMLDNIIEEAIEAKRLLKVRKWWSNPESIETNLEQVQQYGHPVREELLLELSDILVQWLNVLVYLNVGHKEMADHLFAKLEQNDPSSTQATIGNRS